MPSRVIALFLAFVLFWSGFGSIELPGPFASSAPQAHAMAPAEPPAGSVEDHHLDDQPSQAQADPAPETPGMLPVPLEPNAHVPAMVPLEATRWVARRSPFLTGLLRPPCGALPTA